MKNAPMLKDANSNAKIKPEIISEEKEIVEKSGIGSQIAVAALVIFICLVFLRGYVWVREIEKRIIKPTVVEVEPEPEIEKVVVPQTTWHYYVIYEAVENALMVKGWEYVSLNVPITRLIHIMQLKAYIEQKQKKANVTIVDVIPLEGK